ncbi:MAG: PDZ domain-containing protein, partial [Phycisphaerae bacterium]
KADPHAAMAEDADSLPAMPSVRLGIMPSYGESEGPGYEISGVVDGGPAKKAGMKDSDRIFKIGKYKIMDVYGYMEALQGYKPGDKIDVTVLRDGKKIKLIIIGGATKSQEAA